MTMRATMPAKPQISRKQFERQALNHRGGALLAALLVAGPILAAAQQPATQAPPVRTASAAQRKPVHTNQHPSLAQSASPTLQPLAAPEPPKPPDWPANSDPSQANVVWDSQGLRVDASNSSLRQILKDVATATGTSVEGLNSDQRIFGTYGPGPARDVLSQLLDGSGYNVVMVGDMGQGTPRQIVLSSQPKGPAPPAANSQSNTPDENADAQDQPQPQPQPPPQQQPPAIRNGFNPGMPPRTPQQIMQEMQQRQQQIEQIQQQQLQQNNPPR
ncbi:MAG TPA: hypothetical protein VH308_00530 [Terracidiphilus sp.]|nr:hypothetical protein [Terracidiphilus sp.]